MTSPSHTIFVDTNCFIHLRDIQDLPWANLLPEARWIDVVVAPIVIEELDRLKEDRVDRRRNRSRRALDLIEQASREPGLRLVLKVAPVQVSLTVSRGPRVDWTAWPDLDPSRADDQLVAAALIEPAGKARALLSYDRGPLIRARIAGLTAYRSPADWQLPEQSDETTQEVARLKRELDAARATRPTITANFIGYSDLSPDLLWRVPRLPPLPKKIQEHLVNDLIKRHPRATLMATPIHHHFYSFNNIGLSEHNVKQYNTEYDIFKSDVVRYFETLHERVFQLKHAAELKYVVKNASGVTATNLLIEFEGPHNAIVLGDKEDVYRWVGSVAPPAPPKKPKTSQMLSPENLVRGLIPPRDTPRDPTRFFWQERPSAEAKSASLICAEFRATREWHDSFWILPDSDLPFEGKIRLEVTATNLASPVEVSARVRVQEEPARWSDEDVVASLQEWIANIIRDGI